MTTESLIGLIGTSLVIVALLLTNQGRDFLRLVKGNIRQNMAPSQDMNYRIFIPSVVLALLLGALLHSWLGERYRFQAMGNGMIMKTDRWTGEAWIARSHTNQWTPVK